VLECYGYKFPKFANYDWSNWTARVELRHYGADRTPRLEIDLSEKSSPNGAVRISVIPSKPSKDDMDEPALGSPPEEPRTSGTDAGKQKW
jgi:hypothetical protein